MTNFPDNHQKLKLVTTALLFIWTLFIFLPGSYGSDSWTWYTSMTTGIYEDWFGPGLPVIWHLLWSITGSFLALYLLQMLLYWVFVSFLTWNARFFSLHYWVVMILAVFLIFIPQYITRDTLFAIFWSLASLLLLNKNPGNKHKLLTVCILALLLGYGLWIRINALIALIPIVLAAIIALWNHSVKSLWKSLLLSAGISLCLFISVQFLTYKVFHAASTYPAYKLKLLDIIGITKLSGENYLPRCVSDYPYFNRDSMMKNYTPATIDNLYWPANSNGPVGTGFIAMSFYPYANSIIPPPDAMLYGCVNNSWKTAVKNHPLLYLQNRASGFCYYLGIKKRLNSNEYNNAVLTSFPGNPLVLQKLPNYLQSRFGRLYRMLNATFLFDPWFWLLLNIIAFIGFMYISRKTGEAFWQINACIQLSGIIYTLSQFPVFQVDTDFRYSFWNVFAALIAFSALFVKNRNLQKTKPDVEE